MFYRRPLMVTQVMNRVMSRLASLGLTPSDTVRLEVKGRRSGQTRSAVVTWVEQEGQRYLVSPRGESEWVRNVRAAGGEAVIRHRGRQTVRLEEVPPGQRAAIIHAYLNKTWRATQSHFGVDRKAPLEEFERIAALHPVFRVTVADG